MQGSPSWRQDLGGCGGGMQSVQLGVRGCSAGRAVRLTIILVIAVVLLELVHPIGSSHGSRSRSVATTRASRHPAHGRRGVCSQPRKQLSVVIWDRDR